MKLEMLDVLRYLYEYYVSAGADPSTDVNELVDTLEAEGFSSDVISKTMVWLDDLANLLENPSEEPQAVQHAIRVYNLEETVRLDIECRSLLIALENVGILDTESREMIIERCLALPSDIIDVEQLKWVSFLVLSNHPSARNRLSLVDEMFNDQSATVH